MVGVLLKADSALSHFIASHRMFSSIQAEATSGSIGLYWRINEERVFLSFQNNASFAALRILSYNRCVAQLSQVGLD
jgi:hypothetical protein